MARIMLVAWRCLSCEQGTFSFKNGNVYVGGWENDQRHGRGTLKYADGTEYTGSFVQGMKDDSAEIRYKYANGNVYYGKFYNGKQIGFVSPPSERPRHCSYVQRTCGAHILIVTGKLLFWGLPCRAKKYTRTATCMKVTGTMESTRERCVSAPI